MALDPLASLRADIEMLKRYMGINPLENASVTSGRVRFIGGTLRVDSGGRVEIVGFLQVEGQTNIIGPVTISGALTISGATSITGPTTITGTLDVDGDSQFTGQLDITGATSIAGPLDVTGTTELAGDTTVTGDMTVNGGGKITVGTAPNNVTLDSTFSTPRINFGSAQISSAAGNSFTFGMGTDVVYFVDGTIRVPAISQAPSGTTGLRYVVADGLGNFYTASGAGGGDGDTPPNPYPGGYVWPANPAIYGISDNYAAHVARGSAEPGTDVMTPVGAAVYAPAGGEIMAVNSSNSGATGRMIVFRASNGAWFRFLHLSQILVSSGTVTQGQVIGRTGGSGFGSEAHYGAHLHITYLPGPSATQPALTSSTDFEVVMAGQP